MMTCLGPLTGDEPNVIKQEYEATKIVLALRVMKKRILKNQQRESNFTEEETYRLKNIMQN